MIKAIGLDLVEIKRIADDLEKFGDRFVTKILGIDEIVQFNSRPDKTLYLAGRFAAKEAIIKGLGHYLTDRPPFSQLQILNDKTGRPELLLPDAIAHQMPKIECLISITHEKKYAAAVALFTEVK